MYSIGERVIITSVPDCRGTVVGHGFYKSQHFATMSPAYIIELDKGQWTDGGAFISTTVVHPDNVEEVND